MTNSLYSGIAPRAYSEEPTALAAATNVPAVAPVGLGSRPAAWQGTKPQYARPTSGLDPLSVQLAQMDGLSGLQFVTNKGNPASIKAKEIGKKGATETSTGFVPLDPNAQYRFINEKGKDRVLYTGAGEEGLKNVYSMAQDLSATKGKKANWGVEMLDPATGQWSRVADDDPAKSTLSKIGKVVGTALPIATALIPGLQFLGPIATTALAGGAGAALAGRDPLKGAVMGGLSAAGGQLLGPALQGAGLGANAATALGTGLGTTAGGLATGQNLKNALLGGVAAGGLSFLGGELLGPKTPDGTLVGKDVSGIAADMAAKEAAQGLGGALGNAGAGAAGGLGDLLVTAANRGVAPNLGTTRLPINVGGAPAAPGDLTVTAAPKQPPVNLGAGVAGALPSLLPGGATDTTALEKDFDKALDDKNTTLDDIVNYLRLGGLGLGLVGDLFGGGGSGAKQGTIPAGLFGGTGSSTFNKPLPAPSMPGLAAGAGPRTAADLGGQGLASTQDYYRYGYGPEQSFRSNIPAGPRNTSTAYTGYEVPFKGLENMAEGGYAVGGPGDGRDDKIPAMLSDGEYVIDAETVAMLGNGSTKAGADALDKFRVNIRKHKGRALSKGKFSDNAKKPEQYLKKGRR
jgi:hypothetical protein